MPDSVGFYDNTTALENLVYIGELNGIPQSEVRERALGMMEAVGLGSNDIHKKTAAYSRGMKQRLGLADVLIKQPEVIILDEPTLGIDPSGVREFLTIIHQLSRQQGLTVLLSSHHLHQVQQVCDRVGIFVSGKLLVEGNIDTLSKKLFAEKSYEIHVTVQDAVAVPWKQEPEILQLDSVQKVTVEGHSINITCSSDVTPGIVRFFVEKGYDVSGVQKKAYGLDDIYQKYFENNLTENTGK
jgi:ABC-2 type transport system ATP-binding protein